MASWFDPARALVRATADIRPLTKRTMIRAIENARFLARVQELGGPDAVRDASHALATALQEEGHNDA